MCGIWRDWKGASRSTGPWSPGRPSTPQAAQTPVDCAWLRNWGQIMSQWQGHLRTLKSSWNLLNASNHIYIDKKTWFRAAFTPTILHIYRWLSECCWSHGATAQSTVANTPLNRTLTSLHLEVFLLFLSKTKQHQALPSHVQGRI